MVQPYLYAVDGHGETALIFFDGDYSHAIRKGQMLRPGHAPSNALFLQSRSTAAPSDAEGSIAEESSTRSRGRARNSSTRGST